ncbi:Bug family tripartite tricarboxylate transporter substrate binding protein [Parapusillimonas sp. JC17]|uniref:Bug family tripartite tricarboxylate transporter substrate binding protein n=1 Tax=Parapusillimonas sp. JC17 TaxID=3445768 RepID=UPI003F9F5437
MKLSVSCVPVKRVLMGLVVSLYACGLPAHAESQPVRMVVPFSAGSYTDTVARLIAPAMSERLGTGIIVENRPGANGLVGADHVAKAAPNGMTILVGGASVNSINPGLYRTLPYDPVKDLLPVARIGILPFLLVVHPGVPAKTLAEFIAYARSNPGKLAYATPNAATLVGMETFKRSAGLDILSVPYKSSPQAMVDLAGNHVQVLIADIATAKPQVDAGKARLLAVTMDRRSPLLPDVPAMSESVKGFNLSAWTGLLAPAGTPPDAIQRISDALMAALETPDLRQRLSEIGFDIQPLGPAEFGPYLRAEIADYKQLIKDAGIELQ